MTKKLTTEQILFNRSKRLYTKLTDEIRSLKFAKANKTQVKFLKAMSEYEQEKIANDLPF